MSFPPNPSPNDPLGELMRAWSGMAAAAMPGADALGAMAGAPGAAAPAGNPAVGALAQAHWLASGVWLRLGSRAAQSLAQYQHECGAATHPGGADAPARQADAARAHLRRLGEMALDEARALDAQLQGLAEELRASMDDPAAGPAPRRHARAKP
ncbi:hypothetical protein HLB44_07790 [Aquincola sp. S2]|uniref:Poly(3-hydroxyalkanoate) polymerase subunit PhaE n=1 Tax=Pseudaquabacterium terrae TaxID=2732868 RepID=A0ABX2EE51_9BURK|nr:hypothetical protein [Aquabacterium terrae]NRF66881.1 hypothetical protein [Aquabacterium terrae]